MILEAVINVGWFCRFHAQPYVYIVSHNLDIKRRFSNFHTLLHIFRCQCSAPQCGMTRTQGHPTPTPPPH